MRQAQAQRLAHADCGSLRSGAVVPWAATLHVLSVQVRAPQPEAGAQWRGQASLLGSVQLYVPVPGAELVPPGEREKHAGQEPALGSSPGRPCCARRRRAASQCSATQS